MARRHFSGVRTPEPTELSTGADGFLVDDEVGDTAPSTPAALAESSGADLLGDFPAEDGPAPGPESALGGLDALPQVSPAPGPETAGAPRPAGRKPAAVAFRALGHLRYQPLSGGETIEARPGDIVDDLTAEDARLFVRLGEAEPIWAE